MPFTTIQSCAVTPSVTERRPFWIEPSFTGRYSTTFLSFTTSTYLRSWSVPTARSVTRRPGLGSDTGTRTRTKKPGREQLVGVVEDPPARGSFPSTDRPGCRGT
jgi:hypothetical protein